MMEKKVEKISDRFDSENESWVRFSSDYESLLHELKGFKTEYWSSCIDAGVRIYIKHDLNVPFTIYNCGANISIRNIANETIVDVWQRYTE